MPTPTNALQEPVNFPCVWTLDLTQDAGIAIELSADGLLFARYRFANSWESAKARFENGNDFEQSFKDAIVRVPLHAIDRIVRVPYLQMIVIEYRSGQHARKESISTPDSDAYSELFHGIYKISGTDSSPTTQSVSFSELALAPFDGVLLLSTIALFVGALIVASDSDEVVPAFFAWVLIAAQAGWRIPIVAIICILAACALAWLSFRLIKRAINRPEKCVLELKS